MTNQTNNYILIIKWNINNHMTQLTKFLKKKVNNGFKCIKCAKQKHLYNKEQIYQYVSIYIYIYIYIYFFFKYINKVIASYNIVVVAVVYRFMEYSITI